MRFKAVARRMPSGSSEDGEKGQGKHAVNGQKGSSETIRDENGFVNSIVDHVALKVQYEHLVPHELELRKAGAEGVWTKTTIQRGTKYGPYMGKWLQKPIDMRYAWEVRVAEKKGYLDGSVEIHNWLKFIRCTKQNKKQNVRAFLLAGQVYYETLQKIEASQELLLGTRMPLQMDNNGNSLPLPQQSEDFSDPKSVKSDSGNSVNVIGEEGKDYNDENRCFVCDLTFTDVDQLDNHFVTIHDHPADKFACDQCPKSYSWEACLTKHVLLSHRSYQSFPCENCNKTFSDPSNLQRHIRTHHIGARSHACQVCGKTFATSSGLKQHTHIHSSVKPFRCEVCSKAYTQFSNLCRHKRMHAGCKMQIKCAKCSTSFNTNTLLTKHKRFCDSQPTTNIGPPVPLPNNMPYLHHQIPTNSNPYLAYARPPNALPLFSPFVSHYPPLLNTAAGPMPPPFIANSLLFSQPPTKMMEESEKLNSSPTAYMHDHQKHYRRKNNDEPKSETRDEQSDSKAERYAKPLQNGDRVDKPILKRHLVEDHGNDLSAKWKRSPIEVKSDSKEERKVKEKPKESEEPLDLSFAKKEPDETTVDDSKIDEVEVQSEEDEIDCCDETEEVQVTDSAASETKESQIEKSQPVALATTAKPAADSPMAYPRPIHPLLLDNFYRQHFPNFPPPPFSGRLDRALPLPNFNTRQFNFLGHLVNGLQNGQSLGNSFEQLLRPPFPPFNNNTKPFPEMQQIVNSGIVKTKDRYACKFCGKVFPRSANLTRHLRTHTGEQPYKCKYCERSFSISSNLQRHVRNIHNKEKPFKCSQCERCFGQQTNLDRHLRKHEAGDSSGIASAVDSPESANEAEREDAYFDEIRNFFGKVTDSRPGSFGSPSSMFKADEQTSIINPDEDFDDDDDCMSSDEVVSHDLSSSYGEDRAKGMEQSPSPISLCMKSKLDGGDSIINNNSQEAISTKI